MTPPIFPRRKCTPTGCIGLVAGCLAIVGPAIVGPLRATPPTDYSALIISEIYYNPPGTNGIDGAAFEFIELQNIGSTALDVGGVLLTGVSATFGYPTSLGPGEFIVLVRDPIEFSERFPGVGIGGIYSGKLDNAGETIRLLDPAGDLITSVRYSDHLPWPPQADGTGLSLQRINHDPNSSSALNWTAAPPTPGSPTPPELIDTDADGMPDVWELAHGLSVTDRTDANEDPDGDGLSNLAEFRAGTDPRDAADCLRFTSIRFERAPRFDEVILSFQATANHSYTLYQQTGEDSCWTSAGRFEARQTNRVETMRLATFSGSSPIFFHLASPADSPPPCDGSPD